ASPLLYSGLAAGAALGYERVGERTTFGASLDGSVARLLPSIHSAGVEPNEFFGGAAFRLSMLRALRYQSDTKNIFSVGLELGADVSGVQHTYADPSRREHAFGMGLVTIGPQASWTRHFGNSEASMRVSVPLA